MCYAIDQSGSISDSEYRSEQSFVIEIAKAIEGRSVSDPSNSAVAFSQNARSIISPTTNFNQFTAAINKPRLFSGGTSIADGLELCVDTIASAKGTRIVVVITDGKGRDPSRSRAIAAGAKSSGIDIVTVGIGSDVDASFLRSIANSDAFYVNADFDNIMVKIPEVVEAVCKVPIVTKPPSTSAPSTQAPPVVVRSGPCAVAAKKCDFSFAGAAGLPTFDVRGKADQSFTTAVVSKNASELIGIGNNNVIVPEFIVGSTATSITAFGRPNFTPSHLKPFTIVNTTTSGIGHQVFHGNQKGAARKRCVRIYFTAYQQFVGGDVLNFNDVPRKANKCVVFLTA